MARTVAGGRLGRYSAKEPSQTSRFEDSLGTPLGARHVQAINSGTSALMCALVGAGVGPGDEVLVPAWADRPQGTFDADSSPATLDVLARTCVVVLQPNVPVAAHRLRARARRRFRSAGANA